MLQLQLQIRVKLTVLRLLLNKISLLIQITMLILQKMQVKMLVMLSKPLQPELLMHFNEVDMVLNDFQRISLISMSFSKVFIGFH